MANKADSIEKTLRINLGEDKTVQMEMEQNSGRTMRMKAIPPTSPADTSQQSVTSSFREKTVLKKSVQMDVDAFIDGRDQALRHALNAGDSIQTDDHVSLPEVTQQYELLESLAKGGMSDINLARDICLKRITALKQMKTIPGKSEMGRIEFVEEAQRTSQLDHPFIIPIYSLSGDKENGLHMAMKLVKGTTLKEHLRQTINLYHDRGARHFDERKSLLFRLQIFLNVCDAISYAHSKNIIHCDLKPENIMLGAHHETYVMDWGISRELQKDGFSVPDDPPGSISGTPKYISPEAIAGKRLDRRADVFSLGLILFELVTLNFGTVGTESTQIMINTRDGIMNPIQHRFRFPIDKDLAAIIRKAIATDREKRYDNAELLAQDIRSYLAGTEVSANPHRIGRRGRRWVLAHKVITALVFLSLLLISSIVASFFAWNSLSRSENRRIRERVIAKAYSGMTESASAVEKVALSYDNYLSLIASNVEFLMQNDVRFDKKPVFRIDDFSMSLLPRPADFSYAPAYKMNISTAHFSYLITCNANEKQAMKLLWKLYPLHEIFRECLDLDIGMQLSGNPEKTLRQSGLPLTWISIGFENGLFLTYPGNGSLDSSFDARSRSWYLNAKKSNDKWTVPYVDYCRQGLMISCVRQLRTKDGQITGVALLDISLLSLGNLIDSIGIPQECVLNKYLLDLKGRIIYDRNRKGKLVSKLPRSVENADLPLFPDKDIFANSVAQEYGHRFTRLNGKNALYLYIKLHSFPGYYIEVVDFDKLKKRYSADFLNTIQ